MIWAGHGRYELRLIPRFVNLVPKYPYCFLNTEKERHPVDGRVDGGLELRNLTSDTLC